MQENLDNFCGVPDEGLPEEGVKKTDFVESKVVVLPVPYEKTTTYLKGTSKGPMAIIEASKNIEFYDEELDWVPAKVGIFTTVPLKAERLSEKMMESIKNKSLEIVNAQKFPILLGGEHSISFGFYQALKEKYPDISVLQLDAHADLRDSYNGSKHNHACVMRRIRESCENVVQVGVRSLSSQESDFIKANSCKVFWAKDIYKKINTEQILSGLSNNVFVTIDIDVLDPSLLPSTGTPEPGGLGWYDVLGLLRELSKKKKIVGFDVVEVCPSRENKSCDFIAAKLIYKLIGYIFINQKGEK
jgi:agmatinase